MTHKDLLALKLLQILRDALREKVLMKDHMPFPLSLNSKVNSWKAAQVISTSLAPKTQNNRAISESPAKQEFKYSSRYSIRSNLVSRNSGKVGSNLKIIVLCNEFE